MFSTDKPTSSTLEFTSSIFKFIVSIDARISAFNSEIFKIKSSCEVLILDWTLDNTSATSDFVVQTSD